MDHLVHHHRHKTFIHAGIFFTSGTYVGYKIIEFLLKSNRANKSDLDELVLMEHSVNLLNAPIILIQFLRHKTDKIYDLHRSIPSTGSLSDLSALLPKSSRKPRPPRPLIYPT